MKRLIIVLLLLCVPLFAQAGRYQLTRVVIPHTVIDLGGIGEDISGFWDDTLTVIFDTMTGEIYELTSKFEEYFENDSLIYKLSFLKEKIRFNSPYRVGRLKKEQNQP